MPEKHLPTKAQLVLLLCQQKQQEKYSRCLKLQITYIMKEDFIEKIIIQKEILLEITGSFEGIMFPYLKAGDEYLFSKKSLDDWIMEAAKNRRVYTEGGQNKYN